MALLQVNLLATFQVALNGRPVTDFVTDKARALFAYLVVERQQAHRRSSLATLLWPDQPEKRARQNLRQALSHLRQALADSDDTPQPLFLVDRHEVQFNPQADLWLDVAELAKLAAACDNHRHHHIARCLPCLQRLEAMLALYPGDFLAGFSLNDSQSFAEWALLKREWLHCRAMEALTELADYQERRGDDLAARRLAQRQVALEPWREEAHRQLMRLLAAAGQRSAALAQYETCRRILAQELGVDPTAETTALYNAIRTDSYPGAWPARPATTAGGIATLAATTTFVGRAAECAELAEMLADPDGRLITLIGPGGIGKTRLALQVAAAHQGVYAQGVYWVALAPIQTADLIIPSIAQALGVALPGKEPLSAQLTAYLRQKETLLVLDNGEHLPELGDIIAPILAGAPGVDLLVTSRERLALREERLYTVEGFSAEAEALALFLQTAQRNNHKFTKPSADDLAAISKINRLVEGMPLALELAAAWVPDQSCSAVADALAHNITWLTSTWRNVPERQRSVEATFAYSWTLLPERERRPFARLALFRGSFTVQAAAQVAEVDGPLLARLAGKSLLRPVGDGRYQMHQLLRQFAAGKLAESPTEPSAIAARHGAYYLTFLADQEVALKGAGQEAALTTLDRAIANIRQAWGWAVGALATDDPQAANLLQRGLESLHLYYVLRSWYQEGGGVFAQAVTAVPATTPHLQRLRGELLARQAHCREFIAPPEEATALYQESLTCLTAVGADQATALPLYGLGYMAHIQGDYAAARAYFAASLAQYQAADDQWGIGNVLNSSSLVLRRQGDFAAAAEAGRESLAIRQALGDRRGIASSQNNLGLIYNAVGDFAAAESAFRSAAELFREIGHTVGLANTFTGLCHIFFNAQNYAAAAQCQQEALAIYREVGDLWGVAIAYNNLGQIAMEDGRLTEAQSLLHQGVQVYSDLGIKAGLAHALSNLGQAYALAGERTAARYLVEALTIAAEIGDKPTVLEVLARTAVLWGQQQPGARPAALLAFALQQPELLAETRQAAEAQHAALTAKLSPEETAVAASEWARLDLAGVTAVAQRALQQMMVEDGTGSGWRV